MSNQKQQSPKIGQIERKTQNRIVKLFEDNLDYDNLGNREYREENSNLETDLLRQYLESTNKYSQKLIKESIRKLEKLANNKANSLFTANKEFYSRLRYGISLREELGQQSQTINFIDWENPQNNHFAIAEEVTINGVRTKRPDIVLYINGIAVGVIELKRSTVSVTDGIRQNIGNQQHEYIQTFFTTSQLLMAGNDTEGLRYGTTQTPEDYYVAWDPNDESFANIENRLDRHIMQMCQKKRLLELIHDFIIFDNGIKKIARHNQYFAVKNAQENVKEEKGGIIWHTQGSGKSLTMVWLAKWIKENIDDSRVLLLTDRVILDEQIEGVFEGVDEDIHRVQNSTDLINQLNHKKEWLLSSLVHKFGSFGSRVDDDIDKYLKELRKNLPNNFEPKGNLFVFVDECHRSHTGKLHEAMREILPDATFIGFTGTPLLKVDKTNSIKVWGGYIHEYKYNQAVRDGVVLDLRYEARRVPQKILNQEKIDKYFDRKTKGLTDYAKVQLKKKWGTMKALLSSSDRMKRIAFDIIDDFEQKPRLASGRGNAMLVASSIHQACHYYEIFQNQGFEKCAVITSYQPNALDTGSREYKIYQRMLDKYQITDTEIFEQTMKKRFVNEPGRMQILIVVDKLLTGFDTPPTTYLYLDKNMQDHGLFQAVCRVNRLNGDDKDYGYIVDYRDLFKELEEAVTDYTSGAFSGFEKEDVVGLLKDQLSEGKKDLDEALDTTRALCEPVQPPKEHSDYIKYFCGDTENPYSLKDNQAKRVELYKAVGKLLRAYASIANELIEAGYSQEQASAIKRDVEHFETVRQEIRLASGDHINLKKYEPAMRSLLDRYISAGESEQLTTFDDKPLIDILAEKGVEGLKDLPDSIKNNQENVAEAIENNIRKLITEEKPTNPQYYKQMSELLTELVRKRKQADLEYQDYLKEIIELSKKTKNPSESNRYPTSVNTKGKQALYDNLGENETKSIEVHDAIMQSRQDDWKKYHMRRRLVKNAVKYTIDADDDQLENLFEIIKKQDEY